MSGPGPVTDERRTEVSAALERVEQRIVTACADAGRERGEVTLVVVTKFFPVGDVALLHDLGVRHVWENRLQEAQAKKDDLAGLGLAWHFLGQVQSNKAAAVARWADVLHSLDRPKLVRRLATGAQERSEPLDVLVQVDLDPGGGEAQRGGARPDDVPVLLDAVLAEETLRLRGVMAVAPREGDARAAFERLRDVADVVRRQAPGADWISAGMSGDLEQAIACGATHVRVGGAILGNRPTND